MLKNLPDLNPALNPEAAKWGKQVAEAIRALAGEQENVASGVREAARSASGATQMAAAASETAVTTLTALRATPGQPQNFQVVSSGASFGPNGLPVATTVLSWDAVTTDENGVTLASDSFVGAYEVWENINTAPHMLGVVNATGEDTPSIELTLDADKSYTFYVRGRTANVNGLFSEPLVHVTPNTSQPGLQPTAPTLETELGVVAVTWDGLVVNGANVPKPNWIDYIFAEVAAAAGGPWVRTGQTLRGEGVILLSGHAIGSTVWVRLKSMTTAEVESPASPSASIVVTGVDLGTLEADVADAIQQAQDAADAAQTSANGKNRVWRQDAQPGTTGNTVGDIWFDTNDGNKIYTWSGTAWSAQPLGSNAIANGAVTSTQLNSAVNTSISNAATAAANAQTAANAAQTTANGKNKVYYQTGQPGTTGNTVNDVWFDTDDGYRMYVWNGSAWTSSTFGTNAISNDAITAAKIADGTITATELSSAVNTSISNAQTTANGKNKVYYQTGQPGTTGNTTGDIWFDTDNDYVMYVWNGTTWSLSKFDTNAIADAAITAAKIEDATITNAKIATLDAGKITSGTISADRIGANSITAEKLLVGDFTNAVPNALLEGVVSGLPASWYRRSGATTASTVPITTGLPGAAWKLDGVGTEVSVVSEWFPVTPGAKYAVGVRAQNQLTGTSPTAYMRFEWRQKDRTTASATATTSFTIPVANWTNYAWELSVPSDAAFARVLLIHGNNNTGGSWWSGNYYVRGKATGELIVDGSVTAAKMVAGTITAASGIIADAAITNAKIADAAVTNAKIADATIQNAKIATLDAGKITTGTLSADRIGAKSVTVDKLLVGDFTNIASGSDFEGTHPWTLAGSGTIDTAQAHSGTKSLKIAGVPGSGTVASLTTEVVTAPDEQWYVEFWVYVDAEWNGTGNNSKLRLGNQSGGLIEALNYAAGATIPPGVWTKRSAAYTMPAGTRKLQVTIVRDGTAGNAWIDDIVIRRMSGGELIVDGAVTASKIAAGAITAGSAIIADGAITTAKIEDAAITAAKIGSVDAGTISTGFLAGERIESASIAAEQIAVGTITGDRMAAHSITANEIAAGTITSNEIAAGTITASKLAAGVGGALDISANNSISLLVGQVAAVDSEVGNVASGLEDMQTYYQFGVDGAVISSPDSPFAVAIRNDRIEMMESGVPVSYWNAGQMHVESLVANEVELGNHKIEKYDTGTVIRAL